MDKIKAYAKADPRVHRGVPEFLDSKGFSEDAIGALLEFDMALFRWRRMAERGEFKGKVLENLDEKLDPAMLQGLLSVAQIGSGLGRHAAQEPTIGLVADVMAVDPSRASRIVSGLVERGFIMRTAAQDDARKSILTLTPKAGAFLRQFTLSKWHIMSDVFGAWEADEIEVFSRLMRRYVSDVVRVVSEEKDPTPEAEKT
ncbi:MarR family winged helix-turn-helix transcriptional regulator [Celeribacter sp.]|uniref:MarR family winged helix-turn-helix transcriptional regulator n=1 Tax=Celeribacter sp. TaxID=1890673 RepID=UPI003A90D493